MNGFANRYPRAVPTCESVRLPPLVALWRECRDREHDVLHRFLLERAGVRGVLVRLGDSWREVAGRADYPDRRCAACWARA